MKASDLFVSVVVAALVAAGTAYAMNRYNLGKGPQAPAPLATVEAPDVLGLRAEQAKTLLETRGLLLVLGQEQESAQVEPGKVVHQEPLAGSRLRGGESVRVAVARAPQTVAVPPVVGRGASKAKELLTQAGLVPGTVQYRSDEDRSEGAVLEQNPAPGLAVAKGSKIDLVVNRLD